MVVGPVPLVPRGRGMLPVPSRVSPPDPTRSKREKRSSGTGQADGEYTQPSKFRSSFGFDGPPSSTIDEGATQAGSEELVVLYLQVASQASLNRRKSRM